MTKKTKTTEYMLFTMGYWDNIIDVIKEIVEVLNPITEDFGAMRYIHSDTSLICIFKSSEDFNEMTTYIMEELDTIVDVCIILPKPKKFVSRMEESLENHLLGKNKIDLENLLIEDLQDLGDLDDIIGKKTKKPTTNKSNLRINKHDHVILDLDVILDKINATGIKTLTPNELNFLKKQSNI